ncbi:hypothetical protein EDC04DRAFT_381478 [Pisolithus marmoratus]|nr:hypothetical protein EDC04DRAFT_381478 [Pisolithus marmoratus]
MYLSMIFLMRWNAQLNVMIRLHNCSLIRRPITQLDGQLLLFILIWHTATGVRVTNKLALVGHMQKPSYSEMWIGINVLENLVNSGRVIPMSTLTACLCPSIFSLLLALGKYNQPTLY